MKTYVKPELSVESLFSVSTVANDHFDFSANAGGNEGEISANDWWNILG